MLKLSNIIVESVKKNSRLGKLLEKIHDFDKKKKMKKEGGGDIRALRDCKMKAAAGVTVGYLYNRRAASRGCTATRLLRCGGGNGHGHAYIPPTKFSNTLQSKNSIKAIDLQTTPKIRIQYAQIFKIKVCVSSLFNFKVFTWSIDKCSCHEFKFTVILQIEGVKYLLRIKYNCTYIF